MIRPGSILLTLCVLAIGLLGCGGPADTIARDTPKATADAFVEALKAEDYEAIAAGWDYETYARGENSDWDTFSPKARKLIIEKLQEAKVDEVRALAGVLSGEITVGEPQTPGDRAVVQLTAGTVVLGMMLLEVDGVWKVLAIVRQGDAWVN